MQRSVHHFKHDLRHFGDVSHQKQIHRDEVLATPDYTVLHADIGIALMDRGLYEDAEGIFADLAAEEEVCVEFSEMTKKLNSTS